MEDYAASTLSPVGEHTEVQSLVEDDNGEGFVVSLAEGSLRARVAIAAGPLQRPLIPQFLGAHLARQEISVAFRTLFEQMPDLQVAGEPHRLRSSFVNGIKRLPVQLTQS